MNPVHFIRRFSFLLCFLPACLFVPALSAADADTSEIRTEAERLREELRAEAAEIRAEAEAIRREARAIASEARAEARAGRAEALSRAFAWQSGEGAAGPRPFLGVATEPLPAVLRDYIDIPETEGLLVVRAVAGQAAAKAGVRDNDILLTVGGDPVNSPAELSRRLAGRAPGDEINLRILRRGEVLTLPVVLGQRESPVGRWVPENLGKEISAAVIAAMNDGGEGGARILESVREWIPGSVRVVVDDEDRITVDLTELRENLGDLREKLEAMRRAESEDAAGDIHVETDDAGTRSTLTHLRSGNFTLESNEGRAVVTGAGPGRRVLVTAPDGEILHEGPLPGDDTSAIPQPARSLVDRLLETVARLDLPEDADLDVNLTLPRGE
ncbi:MAG: PDZ domain-containing protein [Opitutales bacterium]|nr:PDZ domain-containing protein [Opitutales bacterium]